MTQIREKYKSVNITDNRKINQNTVNFDHLDCFKYIPMFTFINNINCQNIQISIYKSKCTNLEEKKSRFFSPPAA